VGGGVGGGTGKIHGRLLPPGAPGGILENHAFPRAGAFPLFPKAGTGSTFFWTGAGGGRAGGPVLSGLKSFPVPPGCGKGSLFVSPHPTPGGGALSGLRQQKKKNGGRFLFVQKKKKGGICFTSRFCAGPFFEQLGSYAGGGPAKLVFPGAQGLDGGQSAEGGGPGGLPFFGVGKKNKRLTSKRDSGATPQPGFFLHRPGGARGGRG